MSWQNSAIWVLLILLTWIKTNHLSRCHTPLKLRHARILRDNYFIFSMNAKNIMLQFNNHWALKDSWNKWTLFLKTKERLSVFSSKRSKRKSQDKKHSSFSKTPNWRRLSLHWPIYWITSLSFKFQWKCFLDSIRDSKMEVASQIKKITLNKTSFQRMIRAI